MPETNSNPVVELTALSLAYPPSRGNSEPRRALQDVSFAVRPGELFALLGPNGGGKTSLFRILSTLLLPTSGTASVFRLDVVARANEVRRRIGVVFQSPSLDKKLTVIENLRHQGHLYGLHGKALLERSNEMLARVGLSERANEYVENLSGGMQRRAEVAKGLLHRPQLLLLDEPSTGLDPGARRDMWSYLRNLRDKDGVTVLATTHLMEEAERCDRLGILSAGKLVALDTPDKLKAQIGGDVVSVTASNPHRLRDAIRSKFGGDPIVLDGTVRIERERGHEFITDLVEAFPGQIDAVSVGKPTLEDVFIRQTGHRFWEEDEEKAEG
jgi:ABC-2 type transport system ATP-binding protein